VKHAAPPDFSIATDGLWTILAAPGEIEAARAFVARHGAELLEGGRGPGESGPRGGVRPVAANAGASGRGIPYEAHDDRGRPVVVKALRRGGLPSKVRRSTYGLERLAAEMAVHQEAVRRGVPVSRLAFGAVWGAAPKGEVAFLATFRIERTRALAEILSGPFRDREDRRRRHAALRSVGRAVRRAHDLGLEHADLNIGNLLIGEVGSSGHEPEAWVIDLGLSTLGTSLAGGQRASNLVRLLRSAEKHLGSDPGRRRDAAAFLGGYCAGSGDAGSVPRASETAAGREFRRTLLRSIRRRLPAIALHRLGWILTGATRRRRSRPRRLR
jgi:3-deoxy-D-manno-octulosonic acid kinase